MIANIIEQLNNELTRQEQLSLLRNELLIAQDELEKTIQAEALIMSKDIGSFSVVKNPTQKPDLGLEIILTFTDGQRVVFSTPDKNDPDGIARDIIVSLATGKKMTQEMAYATAKVIENRLELKIQLLEQQANTLLNN
jgi:hypothetical protein